MPSLLKHCRVANRNGFVSNSKDMEAVVQVVLLRMWFDTTNSYKFEGCRDYSSFTPFCIGLE